MKRKKLHVKGLKRNPPKPSKAPSQPQKLLVENRAFERLERLAKRDLPNAIIKRNLLPFKASEKLLEFAEEIIDAFVPYGPASHSGLKSFRMVLDASILIWNMVVLAEGSKAGLLETLPELLDKLPAPEEEELKTIFNLIAFHLIRRKVERFSGPAYQFLFHKFDACLNGDEYHLTVSTLSLEDNLASEK